MYKLKNKTQEKSGLVENAVLVLIVVFIWSIVCVTKSVWPFGTMVIDYGDMAEQYVPMYTYLWDVLHGHKSFFFDWSIGLGNNMMGAALHFGVISPFNLFFLFIKRSAIESSMSIYILIKLIAIGISMKVLLRKWIPGLSVRMCISFSLLYVFCVFNMQYYYAVMWLDVAFMFPLVMYGYFLLVNENRGIPYVICLAVTCMMNFQHTYILFVMLLLLTGILPLLSKEKYCKILPQLLISTLVSMMIGAWIWVPGAIQILGSTRKELSMSLLEIYNSIWVFHTAKWMKLLNLGIPISCFIIYAIRNLREKSVKFFCLIVTALCVPICMESTNILWHGGPYQGYTMRFSYMLAFWILVSAAYAYDILIVGEGGKSRWCDRRIANLISVLCLMLLIAITVFQYVLLKNDMTVYKTETSAVVIIFIVGVTAVSGGVLLNNRIEFLEQWFVAIVMMQSLTLALTSVFVVSEKENTFFTMCSNVADNEEACDPITRIKSLDSYLSHNYPLIMQKNAASCYMGVNTRKQLAGMSELGYAQVGYRMSSYGGTLFSDALLGVEEAISREKADDSLYQHQNTYGDYQLYQCLYGYDDGVKVVNLLPSIDYEENNPFFCQNQISKALLGKELFDVTLAEGDEINLTVGEECILYLYAENEKALKAVTVTDLASGEAYFLTLPESGWMNGILELGKWNDTSLRIQISSDGAVETAYCAALNLQDFVENGPACYDNFVLSSGTTSLHISLEGANENEYLFLPVYCDEGWKCTVNGHKTEIGDYAGFLMAIPLQAGKNEIKLSFVPIGFIIGVWITVLGMILLCIIWKFPMKKEWKLLGKICFVLDEAAFGVMMIIFYMLPILFFVKESIKIML